MIMSRASTLAQLRRARGWSQAVLAERSGVSRTGVSAIEMGRLVPSVAAALRLAAALGESVESIFGGGAEDVAPMWAWEPSPADTRCWHASLNDKLLAYPVELTAAGSVPHDRTPFGDERTFALSSSTLIGNQEAEWDRQRMAVLRRW
jgi:transcriptional regulator with XRE-family HTH domain